VRRRGKLDRGLLTRVIIGKPDWRHAKQSKCMVWPPCMDKPTSWDRMSENNLFNNNLNNNNVENNVENNNLNTLNNNEDNNFKTLQEVEKEHILLALELSNGNKTKAANLLGVSIKTIYNKINTYNLNNKSTL
jgi:DNA-binding NtrC family response regulator